MKIRIPRRLACVWLLAGLAAPAAAAPQQPLAAAAVAAAVRAAEQQAAATQPPLALSLDAAVRLALENNLDLAVDRLEPQVAAGRVGQAAAAFLPAVTTSLGRSHVVTPPTSFLVGLEGVTTDAFTSVVGLGQRVPRTGGSYTVAWSASRQTTNSLFSNFNPNLGSQFQVSFSQPLLRDLVIDAPRQQVVVTKRNRDISDTRFRETVVRTLADVKRAYWELATAQALVGVQQQALALAQELVRTNSARVAVGQAPPLDALAARAEQAQREENLLIAEVQARQTEDRLRLLILAPDNDTFWTARLDPTDALPVADPAPDVDAVIRHALAARQDLRRARLEVANAETATRFYRSQRLPDLRVQAAYGASGIAGVRYVRTGGFPGTVSGTEETSFGRALEQVFNRSFPAWTVGITASYPLGRSYDDAALANARIQENQARLRLRSLEVKAIRQLRQAAWQMEMSAKRIVTSRAAREFAEERLSAEQKRFEVGMSTSFLVIQAQRDLAQARNNELAAVVDYRRAFIDYEALQEAGAAGSTATISGGSIVSFGAPVPATSGGTATTRTGG